MLTSISAVSREVLDSCRCKRRRSKRVARISDHPAATTQCCPHQDIVGSVVVQIIGNRIRQFLPIFTPYARIIGNHAEHTAISAHKDRVYRALLRILDGMDEVVNEVAGAIGPGRAGIEGLPDTAGAGNESMLPVIRIKGYVSHIGTRERCGGCCQGPPDG